MIYVDRKQDQFINQICDRIAYNGKKVSIQEAKTTSIDGAWSGGSKEYCYGLELDSGRIFPVSNAANIPVQFGGCSGSTIALEENFAVIKHVIFCGKDLGIQIFVHPANMTKFLPDNQEELSQEEKRVLYYTRSLISKARPKFNQAVVQSLIDRGYLQKNKALTIKGKNVAANLTWENFR